MNKSPNYLSPKSNRFVTSFEIIRDVTVTISRATQWLLNTFTPQFEIKEEYNYHDLDGMCARISALMILADNQFNQYDINQELKLDENEKRANWLSGYIQNFKNFDNYVNKYLDILRSERLLNPWELVDHERIFWSCRQCPTRLTCLYVFKDVFSIFKPPLVQIEGTYLNQLFRSNIDKINDVLNKTFIYEAVTHRCGWPNSNKETSIDLQRKTRIDAYMTASIMSVITDWKTEGEKCSIKLPIIENIEDQKLYDMCIQTIKELQIKDDISVSRELIGDMINIKGSWNEGYWGNYLVSRMKSTANIASFLYRIDNKSNEVRMAKQFIDASFGNNPYVIDLVSFRDTYCSTLSDISGTTASLKFYIELSNDHEFSKYLNCKTPLILDKIKWLINQQRNDGAWPVISENLFQVYKDTNYIRTNLRDDKKRKIHNVSLPNTVDAIKVLTLFLKKYFEG